jgi:hypothetical protein
LLERAVKHDESERSDCEQYGKQRQIDGDTTEPWRAQHRSRMPAELNGPE